MIRGEYVSTYKRHTSRLTLHGLNASITKALLDFSNARYEWEQWSNTPVKHEKAMDLFRSIANSEKMTNTLSDQYMLSVMCVVTTVGCLLDTDVCGITS